MRPIFKTGLLPSFAIFMEYSSKASERIDVTIKNNSLLEKKKYYRSDLGGCREDGSFCQVE